MSAYRTALVDTEETIQRRARLFRGQVVTFAGVGLAAAGLALANRALWPLVMELALIPLVGGFLVADAATVRRWLRQRLTEWAERHLDFAAFRDATRSHPALPTRTLEAMLATLPTAGALSVEQAVTAATREAIAAMVTTRHRSRTDDLLLKVIASAIIVAAILAAFWSAGWWPFAGLSLLAPLPSLRRWRHRRRLARCEAELTRWRGQPDFSESDYERVLASVKE